MIARRSILGISQLLLLGLAAASSAQTVSLPPSASTRFDTERVPESSALVKSRRFEDVFWTLNDSGNSARLFALNGEGSLLLDCQVEGAPNRDWEDLAIDDRGRLYIGDIGNNASRRRDLSVYVVEEHDPSDEREGACVLEVIRRIPFHYPDQPQPPDGQLRNFDSEALYWLEGSLFLLTKHRADRSTRLYQFLDRDARNDPRARAELRPIGSYDLGAWAHPSWGTVTAADASPDGRHLAVLSYRAILVFERLDDELDFLSREPVVRWALEHTIAKQCEAIAWDGDDLVITNEQGDMHRFADVLVTGRGRLP